MAKTAKKPTGRPKTVIDCEMAVIYGIRGRATDYFYIGSTKTSAEHRLAQHLDCYKRGNHSKAFTKCVDSIGIDSIEIDVLEVVFQEQRLVIEYQYIERYLAEGKPLANHVRSLAQDEKLMRMFRKPSGEKLLEDIEQIKARTYEEYAEQRPLWGIRLLAANAIVRSNEHLLAPFQSEITECFNEIRQMFRLNQQGIKADA